MSVGKNIRNGTFAALYCAIFHTPSFRKSLKFFGTSIASLDPETVDLPAFYILSAMFKGVCGPPEKISLALMLRSCVLRTIVKLTHCNRWFGNGSVAEADWDISQNIGHIQ